MIESNCLRKRTPRVTSRTSPLVSKVCNIPMAHLATQVMLGKKFEFPQPQTQILQTLWRQGVGLPLQYVP